MFDRVLYELMFAERALKILCFGLIFCTLTLWLGSTLTAKIELQGSLQPFTFVIQEKILHRYDKAAWFILLSSSMWALKVYIKDRKRMM